ncbi:hypothetical protein [Pseudochryseolinea flava]|uniref:Uncharacterized protein n=1 Tax=Pseudochryseolinea flava TaxID=2059302 RepID=A0A364XTS4_9BACT|nr:hypothetical protein [Pseudochryseolinea flava]RAV97670.1 hypothetical protein DQQ10_27355 [Pseudochryseolinea flava]
MSKATKIAIGLSIASGALLTAWLLSGSRKEKTKAFIAKKASSLKKPKVESKPFDDSEAHYI